MDSIETTPIASAPAAALAAAPAPASTLPVATAPASTPVASSGGDSVKSILKNLDWVQVGFGVLASTTLFYAIYYYRYNIAMTKSFVKNVEGKIDELTIKYSDVSSALDSKKEEENKQNTNKGTQGFV